MDGLAMEYRAYANDNPTHAAGTIQAQRCVQSILIGELNMTLHAATVAIKILTSVIERSKATTMMGLEKEMKEAAAVLRRRNPSLIPLEAGCELFLRYVLPTLVPYSSSASVYVPVIVPVI